MIWKSMAHYIHVFVKSLEFQIQLPVPCISKRCLTLSHPSAPSLPSIHKHIRWTLYLHPHLYHVNSKFSNASFLIRFQNIFMYRFIFKNRYIFYFQFSLKFPRRSYFPFMVFSGKSLFYQPFKKIIINVFLVFYFYFAFEWIAQHSQSYNNTNIT